MIFINARNTQKMIRNILIILLLFIGYSAKAQIVAKIGDTEYTSFAEAVAAAQEGEVVTLVKDDTIRDRVDISKSITIDLGNCKLINKNTKADAYYPGENEKHIVAIYVTGDCTLTINGEEGGIYHDLTSTPCTLIYVRNYTDEVEGNLIINGGHFVSYNTGLGTIAFVISKNFTMNGGTVENYTSIESDKEKNLLNKKNAAIFLRHANQFVANAGRISSNIVAIYDWKTKTDDTETDTIKSGVVLEGNVYIDRISKFPILPDSCLIFTDEDSSDDNVIYSKDNSNLTCQSLVITDGIKYKWQKLFTVDNATYTRQMTNSWGTLCLPFSIDIKSSTVDCYDITGVTDGGLTLSKYASNVPAGTPVIIKKIDESQNVITIKGGLGDSTKANPVAPISTSASLYGCYADQEIVNDNENKYYFVANNLFYSAERKTSVPAYRAYFTVSYHNFVSPTWEPSSVYSMTIGESELTPVKPDAKTSGPIDLNQIVEIRNTNGVLCNELQPGTNLVKLADGSWHKISLRK